MSWRYRCGLVMLSSVLVMPGVRAFQDAVVDVVDVDGQRIKGAIVEVDRVTTSGRAVTHAVAADDAGKYRVLWTDDTKHIRVRADGYITRTMAVRAAKDASGVIALERAVQLKGRVVNGRGDGVQADVLVGSGHLSVNVVTVSTLPDGGFSVPVASGLVRLSARADGMSISRIVNAHENETVTLRVVPMARFVGTLVGAQGVPLARTRVLFHPKTINTASLMEATSDDAGAFEVRALDADVPYQVVVVTATCREEVGLPTMFSATEQVEHRVIRAARCTQ